MSQLVGPLVAQSRRADDERALAPAALLQLGEHQAGLNRLCRARLRRRAETATRGPGSTPAPARAETEGYRSLPSAPTGAGRAREDRASCDRRLFIQRLRVTTRTPRSCLHGDRTIERMQKPRATTCRWRCPATLARCTSTQSSNAVVSSTIQRSPRAKTASPAANGGGNFCNNRPRLCGFCLRKTAGSTAFREPGEQSLRRDGNRRRRRIRRPADDGRAAAERYRAARLARGHGPAAVPADPRHGRRQCIQSTTEGMSLGAKVCRSRLPSMGRGTGS